MTKKTAHYHDNSTSNVLVGLLIGLVLVLIGLVTLSNRKRISTVRNHDKDISRKTSDISGTTSNTPTETTPSAKYFLGKEVSFTGTLSRGGDFTNYTHVLTTSEGVFGLKSSKFLLDDFVGEVIVGGRIDAYVSDIYVVNVGSIVLTKSKKTAEQVAISNNRLTGVQYLPEVGVMIDDLSGSNLTMTRDAPNKSIIIKDTTASGTTATISLMYFDCDPSSNLTNCEYLQKTFSTTSSVGYTSREGDIFYTIPETTSLFASIDNRFGYYLEAKDKLFLIKAMEYVHFIGNDYITNMVTTTAKELCQTGSTKLYNIYTIDNKTQADNNIIATIQGDSADNKKVVCTISVDPSYRLGGTVKNIVVSEKSKERTEEVFTKTGAVSEEPKEKPSEVGDNTQDVPTTTTLIKDPNIDQFPIYDTAKKQYVFTAKAGYTITFPSNNIWFSLFDTKDKTLGYEGLYCEATYHVIKYSKDEEKNKQVVDTDPQTNVFVCNVVENLRDELEKSFFVKVVGNRMFLTQPIDPSWYDFAKNIEVK